METKIAIWRRRPGGRPRLAGGPPPWESLRLIALLLFALVAAPSAAQMGALPEGHATGTFTVSGELIMGTPGGTLPGDLPVALLEFGEGEPRVVAETRGAQGKFSFSPLTLPLEHAFVVRVLHAGVEYYGEALHPHAGPEKLTSLVTVYETAAEPGQFVIRSLHIILSPAPGALGVTEILVVENPGQRTLLPPPGVDPPAVLRLDLPQGFHGLQPMRGLDPALMRTDARGLVDASPFPPGQRSVVLQYLIPAAAPGERTWLFDHPLSLALDSCQVMVDDPQAAVESPQLASRGPVTMRDKQYLLFTGGPLAAGTPLRLTLTAGAAPPGEAEAGEAMGGEAAEGEVPPMARRMSLFIVLLFATGVALLAAVALRGRRRPLSPLAVDLAVEKGELLEELSRLAADSAADDRRREARERLREVMRRLEGL